MSHVYPGARYQAFEMWNEEPNSWYFGMLEEHQDKILIELAGHDHFPSLRAHAGEQGGLFHNLFVAPSITPWYKNNPGVTSFEISQDRVPQNLRSTFLNLAPTIRDGSPLPVDEFEFREVNYGERYGVE